MTNTGRWDLVQAGIQYQLGPNYMPPPPDITITGRAISDVGTVHLTVQEIMSEVYGDTGTMNFFQVHYYTNQAQQVDLRAADMLWDWQRYVTENGLPWIAEEELVYLDVRLVTSTDTVQATWRVKRTLYGGVEGRPGYWGQYNTILEDSSSSLIYQLNATN